MGLQPTIGKDTISGIDSKLDRLEVKITKLCKYSMEDDKGNQGCYSLFKADECIEDSNCITPVNTSSLKDIIEQTKKAHINAIVSISKNKVVAADTLKISYRTLMSELKEQRYA